MTAKRIAFCYVTCPSAEEARAIACRLVEERLASSANILPGVASIYRWQGAIHDAEETVLILKTRLALAERVIERVKSIHSYQCPCVTIMAVHSGNADYLAWIAAETLEPLDPTQELTHK